MRLVGDWKGSSANLMVGGRQGGEGGTGLGYSLKSLSPSPGQLENHAEAWAPAPAVLLGTK